MSNMDQHNAAVTRFIDLANSMKDEGQDIQLISAALMAASGIYVTYTSAGNNGVLQPSGIDKVLEMYRRNLDHIQARKREELQAKMQGGDTEQG